MLRSDKSTNSFPSSKKFILTSIPQALTSDASAHWDFIESLWPFETLPSSLSPQEFSPKTRKNKKISINELSEQLIKKIV